VRQTLSFPLLVGQHGEAVAKRMGISLSALVTLLIESPLADLYTYLEANPRVFSPSVVVPSRLTSRTVLGLRHTVNSLLERARTMQGQLEL
jgi:hypothetical protein